ncbi:TetR/AcrR family transcriptional regulator [Streptomyces sp. PTM05]|uniref:TetR/AcrR family transcriptional regulator n=1 Tax=Streptantibioticus parmotrematis TaxID=2873249 RepID=A0ABS7R0J9_9ACTN|nr:TetR/AcrR family transcriptional regulator [Streptantibioticus parmotrematis]MBY8888987.1 TetR/AcrR family transcriptional regulator [Streptantibioticus parmotrematis]
MTTTEARPSKLTPRGRATRERIIQAAAELIYEHGVQNTNNERIRLAAGVSGSQLTRHFPTKESLVRAVIAWRADTVIALHKIPQLGHLDTFASLRLWADSYIEREELCRGGCSYGSLAGEALKAAPSLRPDVADGFERWEDLFRAGLTAMRERGDLRPQADPDQLTHLLMAAFQGGMLLNQAADDVAPLRDALDAALAHVESFATHPVPHDDATGGEAP